MSKAREGKGETPAVDKAVEMAMGAGDQWVTLYAAYRITARARLILSRWVREGRAPVKDLGDGARKIRIADLLEAIREAAEQEG